jgi:anti-sigma factor RsiW
VSQHVDDRVVAYLDGELSDTEAAAVATHAEACERCARSLREARAVMHVLESDESAQPLESMWPAVESRLRRRMPAFDLPFATATAAALTVGVMLGVLTFDERRQPVTPATDVATATDAWSAESDVLLADIYLSDPSATEAIAP